MRLALSAALLVAALPLAVQPARALDRRITLVNNSSYNIREFHASNANRGTYEEDILRHDPVPPGEQVVVNLDDGTDMCVFDFLTVMSNGAKIEKRGVDVCQLETYSITD